MSSADQIDSIEQLNALPPLSIVGLAGPTPGVRFAIQKETGDSWWAVGTDPRLGHLDMGTLFDFGPALLLWSPEQ